MKQALGALWTLYFILKVTGSFGGLLLGTDMVRCSVQTRSLDREAIPRRKQHTVSATPAQGNSAAVTDINAGFRKLALGLYPPWTVCSLGAGRVVFTLAPLTWLINSGRCSTGDC